MGENCLKLKKKIFKFSLVFVEVVVGIENVLFQSIKFCIRHWKGEEENDGMRFYFNISLIQETSF